MLVHLCNSFIEKVIGYLKPDLIFPMYLEVPYQAEPSLQITRSTLPSITFIVDNKAHITKHNLAQFQIRSGFQVGEWHVTSGILWFLGLGTWATTLIPMPSNNRIPSGPAIHLYKCLITLTIRKVHKLFRKARFL
jgi:hypothetical protein